MAQLPPKIPSITHPNWPPAFSPHQRMPPLANINPPPQTSTAASPPSWIDEFLDFTSSRRGSHRRSVSDSIAFLETPLADESRNSLHGGASGGAHGGAGEFERLDDEQLMSMFSDDVSGGMPGMVGPPSSPSDQNSNNEDKPMSTDNNNDDDNNNNNNSNNDDEYYQQLLKSEPGEVDSAGNSENLMSAPPLSGTNAGHVSDCDPIDPKRVKRILANRQSAQRSRVRKLQYISELERSVTTLQTEVSALSPRVAFLDHQRLILNVDNSALKQRIAALAQDKIFKDAHQEALRKEIERLRQIYQQQQHTLKKMNNTTNYNSASALPPSSDHNMGCTDKEQLVT